MTDHATPSAESAPDRGAGRLRLLGLALVLTLLGQLVLGMANTFWLSLPDSGSGWDVAAPAMLLTAHMTLGTALLVLAIWIAVLAVRRRDRSWLIVSAVGIVSIVVAFSGGSVFMGETSNDGASFAMAVGCAIAIGAYTVALFRLPAPHRAAA